MYVCMYGNKFVSVSVLVFTLIPKIDLFFAKPLVVLILF